MSLILLNLVASAMAIAALDPSVHYTAGGTKTGNYVTEGYFTGGNRSVTAARLKDIRRADSPQGYERLVLDLETQGDSKGAVPYFQLQSSTHDGRYVLSIWADVAYDFDANRIRKVFAKSKRVRKLNIVPRVEDGLTIIEFMLDSPKGGKQGKFEVFHLANPARIIMDLI